MTSPTSTGVLRVGDQLSRQAITSPAGTFTLIHQPDGNVVIYRNSDGQPIWATGTDYQSSSLSARPGRFVLQDDGNLVVYNHEARALWSSGTDGLPASELTLADDGSLTLSDGNGAVRWFRPAPPIRWDGWHQAGDGFRLRRGQNLRNQSLTSPNGQYVFVQTDGGDSALFPVDGPAVWTYRTDSRTGIGLTAEGQLVRRHQDGTPYPFGSGLDLETAHQGEVFLVRDEGDAVLLDAGGAVIWSTHAAAPEVAGGELDPRLRTSSTPVIRTDFSDQQAWDELVPSIAAEHEFSDDDLFQADVAFIDDPDFDGLGVAQLLDLMRPDQQQSIMLVVDAVTMAATERPVLVVDLSDFHQQRGRSFRALPHCIQGIENNLSLANMDWEDFADGVDDDGVLRDDLLWGRPEDA